MTLSPNDSPPILAYRQAALPIPEGWTNAHIYGYFPEKAASVFHARVIRYFAALAIVLPLALLLQWKYLERDRHEALVIVCTMLCIFVGVIALRVWRMKRLIERQWPTFRLILADQGVARICQGFPDLVLPFAELYQAREQAGRGILLRGKNRLQVIWIPSKYVEGYAEIRAHLAVATPLQPFRRRWLLLTRQVAWASVVLAGLFGTWFWGEVATDIRVELPCVFVSLALVVWSCINSWRNPNIMRRQKIASIMLIILPLELFAKIFLLHR